MYITKEKFTVVIAYIVNFYLLVKIIFGVHGIIDFHRASARLNNSRQYLQDLTSINDTNQIKAELISKHVVNIRYIQDLVRVQYSMLEDGEKVLILK